MSYQTAAENDKLATIPGTTDLVGGGRAMPPKEYRSPEWVAGYEAALDDIKFKRQEMLSGVRPIESVWDGHRNGELIAVAAKLWVPAGAIVLDPTYGRGLFYTHWKPETLIAHDLYTVDGVDYRALPEDDESVDVVIFDPPYVLEGGRETSTVPDMLDRFGTFNCPTTMTELWAMNDAGMDEAVRVLKPSGRLIVKTMDFISSGKFVQGHYHVVQHALLLGLEQVDEFVHYSGTGPQPTKNRDGSPRRQVHSRHAHSFLCVFQKPKRRK